MSAQPVRMRAAKALAEVLQHDRSLTNALPRHSKGLVVKDQSLMQELCFGVCRYQQRLAVIAEQFLQKPFKSKDADIQALLYLGIYQLLFTRVPDHAAIGATVEAATHLKKNWAKGMLNGVLRNVQRGAEGFAEQPWAQTLDYQFCHPQWLTQRLTGDWPEHWRDILSANNEHPPMTLRVNRRQCSRDHYLASLSEDGIDARATAFSADGVQLDQPCNVSLLPGFDQGRVSVQDESAQLAAQLLELAPAQRVLDACCAPGGKTCHILEREAQLQELVAVDLDPARLQRVQDNLQRLQLSANLKSADVGDLAQWWDGRAFDRILLDAPCSATGVIRRHPDIKMLRRDSDIVKLVQLQQQLLQTLWRTLAPGGLLVYATCSVLADENERVIAHFVANTDDAEHQVIQAQWGMAREFGRQLFPRPGAGDGFYYAVLRKAQG